MRSHEVRQLLLAARVHFDRDLRIPTDIATKLMAHGVIVSRLEDQWSNS